MVRFTIRDVLWLTVVVALGVAMWVAGRRSDAKISQLKSKIEREKILHAAEVERMKEIYQAAQFVEGVRHRNELRAERQRAMIRAMGIPVLSDVKPKNP